MGRSQETFSKKEIEKKKLRKRKEKQEKKQERKANADKGKSLEDMMAYVDEYGNITSTPPDPKKKKAIKKEDIEIGVPRQEDVEDEDEVKNGVVTFFNDSKGYGFIKEKKSQQSIFFHVNGLEDDVKENNLVSFEITMTPKGPNAVKVKQVK